MPLVLARYTLMQVMSAEGLRSRVHKSDIGTASPVAKRTFVERYLYDCSADELSFRCDCPNDRFMEGTLSSANAAVCKKY